MKLLGRAFVNLNFVVAGMDGMFRRLIGERIDLQAPFLDPTLGCVKADQGHVEQVIMNLVVSARDALPNGGRLTIETANGTSTKPTRARAWGPAKDRM